MKKILLLLPAPPRCWPPRPSPTWPPNFRPPRPMPAWPSTQTDIAMAQMHLQHAVNCLVGPGGAGFDAAAGNPCGKAGNGAIPDSMDAAQKAKLTSIAASAKQGVGSSDLATVQQAAKDTVAAVAAAK